MGYCISLELNDKAPVKKIVEILSNSTDGMSGIKGISDNPDEHTYAPDYKNGISISFRTLKEHDSIFVYKIVKELALIYGVKKKDLQNNINLPFFYYDNEITFILNEEQEQYFNKSTHYTINENGKERIISESEVDQIDEDIDSGKLDSNLMDCIREITYTTEKVKIEYPIQSGIAKMLFKKSYEKTAKNAIIKAEEVLNLIKG